MRPGPDNQPWLTSPTFSSPSQGRETVREAAARGWGYRRWCMDCGDQQTLHCDRMLERLVRAADIPMIDIVGHFRCGACGSPRLRIWPVQSALVNTGHRFAEDKAGRERMVAARIAELTAT